MEARNRNLFDWMGRIRNRQIVLPRFQRYEAWHYTQIEALFNTVLKQLPAGAILILEIGDEEPFVSRPIVGAPSEGEKITEHLLDGQQRLTSFWRALNNLYEDRTYFIKIEDSEELDLPFHTISVARYYKKGRQEKYPLWVDDPVETWSRKCIPIHLLGPGANSENNYRSWAEVAAADDMNERIYLIEIGGKLRSLFAGFNIPFLSLPVHTKPEIALDVFIRMNTSATPLTAFDIVVAQIEAASDKSLHDYIIELEQEVPNIVQYVNPRDIVLPIAALLIDKIPSKSTYLSREFAESFTELWVTVKKGLQKTIGFLEEEKIFDNKRLPSDIIFYVLSALWGQAKEGLDQEGELRGLLRKYMWRSFFTERYDRSTSTRVLADYRELVKFIADGSGHPPIFDSEQYPVANIDDLKTAAWPTNKDRLARAVLALTLKTGGIDFADGTPASKSSLARREYHHIYPASYLEKHSNPTYKPYEINRALNCALISWKTNRNIAAKKPSDYTLERMQASSLGESEIMYRLQSHQIDMDALCSDDYDVFIDNRARSIKKMVDALCNGYIVS